MRKILIIFLLCYCDFLYGQKLHKAKLPAEDFISFKLLKFNTQINNSKDVDFTAEIKNISKQVIKFYSLNSLNGNYEFYKCKGNDSTIISDCCVSVNDPLFTSEGVKPLKYYPNESFRWQGTLPGLYIFGAGLYKVRFIIKVGANNPLIDNYYSKWYYINVAENLKMN